MLKFETTLSLHIIAIVIVTACVVFYVFKTTQPGRAINHATHSTDLAITKGT